MIRKKKKNRRLAILSIPNKNKEGCKINILVPDDDRRVFPSNSRVEFSRLCDKVVYEVQDRIRLLPLKSDDVFRECLVDEECLLASAGVNTNDRVNSLDRLPAKNAADLGAVLGLLDARVERIKGLEIAAERRRQAVIGSNHTDVLGISSASCRDRETCQESCGRRLALERLVVVP